MFNISDTKCPVCGGTKRKIINVTGLDGSTMQVRSEEWWYVPQENEIALEGYCTECGVKFVTSI